MQAKYNHHVIDEIRESHLMQLDQNCSTAMKKIIYRRNLGKIISPFLKYLNVF